MKIGTKVLLQFLERFDANSFIVKINGEEFRIGDGVPAFTVSLSKAISLDALSKLVFTATNKKNQQKEVCSHYDLGNDFYGLWLGFPTD